MKLILEVIKGPERGKQFDAVVAIAERRLEIVLAIQSYSVNVNKYVAVFKKNYY